MRIRFDIFYQDISVALSGRSGLDAVIIFHLVFILPIGHFQRITGLDGNCLFDIIGNFNILIHIFQKIY